MITKADAVNHILSKFKSEVRFIHIDHDTIEFRMGYEQYLVNYYESYAVWHQTPVGSSWDNYAKWVENILNGLVRNEAGEMIYAIRT